MKLLTTSVKMSTVINYFVDELIAKKARYNLIDIGANLCSDAFKPEEIAPIIDRSKAAGITKMMITGSSETSSKKALELAKLYPDYLFSTAGVHPHESKLFNESTIEELRKLCQNPECVSVGECGLDFNRNFSPQDDQRRAFDAQVELACELQKPLFIHEREAHEDLMKILQKERKHALPPTVIHCFTGTVAEMQSYLDAGFYIGLTGFLWKDKLPDGVQYALKNRLLPLERLMIETDCPYMFPNIRAKKLPQNVTNRLSDHAKGFLKQFCSFDRNEPCSLAATCELVAGFMDLDPVEVARQTSKNSSRVFGLDN